MLSCNAYYLQWAWRWQKLFGSDLIKFIEVGAKKHSSCTVYRARNARVCDKHDCIKRPLVFDLHIKAINPVYSAPPYAIKLSSATCYFQYDVSAFATLEKKQRNTAFKTADSSTFHGLLQIGLRSAYRQLWPHYCALSLLRCFHQIRRVKPADFGQP